MKKLGIAGVALLAIGVLLLPSIGSAQCSEYPLCSESGQVSDGAPRRGQTITFSYSGGEGSPGSSFSVDLLSHPRRLTTGTFDSSGNFSVRVTIPSDAELGGHTLRAVGPSRFGGQLTVTAFINVVAGAPLTATGSNTVPLLMVGLGSIMVGGTFVGFGFRRRKTAKV